MSRRRAVAASPGGSLDFLARLLGEQIGQVQGQTVLIEERAGAGGAIGAEAVLRAAHDGNTLFTGSRSRISTVQRWCA
jgi:tripartite-type tricarboxylate transporter receptor subunit TctC